MSTGTERPERWAGEIDGAHSTTSVHKALALLDAVVAAGRPARLSELAASVDLARSTAHRLLRVLEEAGMVGRDGVRYLPGNRLLAFAESAGRSAHGRLLAAAHEPLAALFDSTEATVHLAVAEATEVRYLEKLSGPRSSRLPTRVGGCFPVTCTALGKAMLAFSAAPVVSDLLARPLVRMTPYSIGEPKALLAELNTVRRDRVAFTREEGRLGVSCVAAPVLVDGSAVAAVSLSLAGNREPTPGHARLVQRAALCISVGLGGRGAPRGRFGSAPAATSDMISITGDPRPTAPSVNRRGEHGWNAF